MRKNQVNDKSIFVVGVLATFLAFSTFKEELHQIIVFSTPTGNVSLLSVLVVFVFLLSISVYLYALDYVKYSYGSRIQNHFFFKIIIWLANFFYSIAIFFPIFVIISLIFKIPIIDNVVKKYTGWVLVFDVVMGLLWIATSLWNSYFLNKKLRKDSIDVLERNVVKTLENATKMLKDSYYSASIIEAYKVLILSLREKLLQNNILTENISDINIRKLALEYKIISKDSFENFNKIIEIRNRAVHFDVSFTKDEAEFVIKTVNQILTKID